MYLDWTYLVFVLPPMLFAMWASSKVNSTFKRYSGVYTHSRQTGAEIARRMLDANGLSGVSIEHISGSLTDHYDPTSNVVRLSDSVYGKSTTAAIGVACHECGHAIQHATGYSMIKLRMAIIPITNFGSKLAIPLIILGIVLSSVSYYFTMLAYVGVALFGLSTLFQLVTLPVELDASRRALNQIKTLGLLDSSEYDGAKKVLTAAAMTYVAALASSLGQLLRFLVIVSGSSNNRRR